MKMVTREIPTTVVSFVLVDEAGETEQMSETVVGLTLSTKEQAKRYLTKAGYSDFVVTGIETYSSKYGMSVGMFVANAQVLN